MARIKDGGCRGVVIVRGVGFHSLQLLPFPGGTLISPDSGRLSLVGGLCARGTHVIDPCAAMGARLVAPVSVVGPPHLIALREDAAA